LKYQLLNPINPNYSTIETILTNRGIPLDQIQHYLNTTDDDINDFFLFGKPQLADALVAIDNARKFNKKCLVIVDSDCDGYTSAAVMTNYLHDIVPEWTENHLRFYIHGGKQHGLADVEVDNDIALVIVPDAGSNDYYEHKQLNQRGIGVIVLDHHEAEKLSEDAVVINNQMSDYPNKAFSGVGVVWQFCRYIDSIRDTDYANHYLDLVALGLDADMMSLRSLETKHVINKGLESQNVRNPFFAGMADKNSFSLKGKLTPIGVAFYIAPLVNSMVRSGTQEEKMLLFKSMLKHEAFKKVPSTKRGKKPGDTERIVDQALRVATNVKSRQTKAQTAGLDKLESMIVEQNLLQNKVLLFLCEANSLPKNIGGLIANKFMAKYQRHTAILFKDTAADGTVQWRGSARGCPKSKIDNFKQMCEDTGVVEYAQGHPGAFGLGILDSNIQAFLDITNEILADDSGEAIYYVDYIFDGYAVNGQNILDIASLSHLWGQDMPEALVAIKGLKVTEDMVTLMSADKNPTIKITIPNENIAILKFKSSQKEYESLLAGTGYLELDIVGTCNMNEWNGYITPQIFMKDYQIVDSNKYYF